MRPALTVMFWLFGVAAAAAQTAGVASKLGPIPPVPRLPPAPAAVTPPDLAPPHPTDLPPAVQPDPHAPGAAQFTKEGLRITFGPDSTSLNPITAEAIRALARPRPADPVQAELATYEIDAFAPGTPQDPSAPRRLSLERGLAVRSVLMHAGIASTRIFVHALGARGLTPGQPSDRVDVRRGTLGQGPAAPAPSPQTGSSAAP